MKKILGNIGFSVWLATLFVIGITLGYWRLDNEMPLTYSNGRIEPNPALLGSRVTLTWDIDVKRKCPGTAHRMLYKADDDDEPPISYDRTPSALTFNKNSKELVKTFILPATFPSTWNVDNAKELTVRYEATVCFECNPLQKFFPICKPVPPIFFIIDAMKLAAPEENN